MMIAVPSRKREMKSRKIAQGGIHMKSDFIISNISTGKLNAVIKNIMAQIGIADPEEAVRMVNAGEVQISVIKPRWTEKDDIIYFSVTSDGTTGKQWIARLKSKGFRFGHYANGFLCSKYFKPTSGITYEIAVLKGELFSNNDRITKNIRKDAKNRKLSVPNTEVACLIREKFSDKEIAAMGLYWVVVMHKPVEVSDGDPRLLYAYRDGNGSCLGASYDHPDSLWDRSNGFAFVVSQVSNS